MPRLIREIREEAVRARTTTAPELTFTLWRRFADTGDRRAYERAYFERRRRLAALALAACLDDRPDPALDDLLWSVCDEYAWVLPAHEPQDRPVNDAVDLFAAETAHALAEVVTLPDGHVDPRVRARVRAEVDRRVLRPLQENRMWWETAEHNWAAVCAGAAGMAALALDSERLPALLPRLEQAMASFLSGTGPDGACLEGPDYWTYGFGYLVYFAEALRERTGRDLLDDPHVRAMASYPAGIDFGDGHRPAFADSQGHGAYPSGLLDRLSERLGVAMPDQPGETSFHDDPCYRWAHLSRTLWWTTGAARHPAEPQTYLPDAGIVVARAGGTAFAAKGGHNDEPHNHLDLGHFVVHADGETILDDLGAPEYTRGYFGDDRYQTPQAAAEWHSIPMIDGTAQRPGRDRRATVVHHAPGHPLTFALDLTAAYDTPRLARITRTFTWRPGRLDLTDAFDFTAGECLVEELFVSRRRPDVRPGKVVWGPVELDVPAPWQARAEELEVRGHDGVPETVHRVRLTATVPSGAHRFVFTVRAQAAEQEAVFCPRHQVQSED
ncbi:heparinase II/III family protein [Nonomuraea sp. SYSU D8015]|uniref:heparinase II/III family protein n=1 Tax=Nonomuraea sp. SYSU D8015 TaxID=2593644 RepID=UPI001660554A|nr:heparinase II/III family protein [Nonomuraea sp. SYSU D8015]